MSKKIEDEDEVVITITGRGAAAAKMADIQAALSRFLGPPPVGSVWPCYRQQEPTKMRFKATAEQSQIINKKTIKPEGLPYTIHFIRAQDERFHFRLLWVHPASS